MSCIKRKYNIKTAHWVGHSQLISLDTDDFLKSTPIADDIQASVTSNTINHSASEEKNNPYFYNKNKNKNLKRLMMMLI